MIIKKPGLTEIFQFLLNRVFSWNTGLVSLPAQRRFSNSISIFIFGKFFYATPYFQSSISIFDFSCLEIHLNRLANFASDAAIILLPKLLEPYDMILPDSLERVLRVCVSHNLNANIKIMICQEKSQNYFGSTLCLPSSFLMQSLQLTLSPKPHVLSLT